jgi:hypothetical protein
MANRPQVRDGQNFRACFNDRTANSCHIRRMAPLHVPVGTKAVYRRGVVTCRKCDAAIHFHRLAALAAEFSVRCDRCGERGLYAKREIGIEELPERRRKPRRER